MPKQWVLREDQWSRTYYELRDDKLYFVEIDNKEQQYSEREQDIDAIVRDYAATPSKPYPELVAFLADFVKARR